MQRLRCAVLKKKNKKRVDPFISLSYMVSSGLWQAFVVWGLLMERKGISVEAAALPVLL